MAGFLMLSATTWKACSTGTPARIMVAIWRAKSMMSRGLMRPMPPPRPPLRRMFLTMTFWPPRMRSTSTFWAAMISPPTLRPPGPLPVQRQR